MRHQGSDSGPGSEAVTTMRPAVAPGDRLKDRYDVVGRIGSGGMADVFEGIDNLFQRDVAIKVLRPERVDEVMQRRVLREARATCAVDHPHMLRVTDMGFVGAAPFLVSDLLRGHSLAEELRRSPRGGIGWRRVVGLMLPAMAALHAAHEAGLVHRDIKPENLFLHRRGAAEVVMVLDLGIVKHTSVDGSRVRWTRSGVILGTALYMAPEQINAGLIDRRADVYSMGVTLHRLLSGEHLFPPSPSEGPIPAMTRHLYEPPPRLVDRRLPPRLIAAVHTAVAKDPDRRHATMAAFAEILAACLVADEARAATRRRVAQGAGVFAVGAALALGVAHGLRAEMPAIATTDAPRVATAVTTADETEAPVPAAGVVVPERVPAANVAAPVVEPAPARRTRARGDELGRASAAVEQCLRRHGDLDTRSVTVHVDIAADGRVAATNFEGPFAASFLGACVRDVLAGLRFTPGSPRTRAHTYRLGQATKKETP